MATPLAIVAYLALFIVAGGLFLLANLLIGYLLRPHSPNAEKLEIYECGEPTIGSSFVQFDLRFYVVALLFIVFDVEVALFFPWATVFGKSVELAAPSAPLVAAEAGDHFAPPAQLTPFAYAKLQELGVEHPTAPVLDDATADQLDITNIPARRTSVALRQMADKLAWTSLIDIGIFFAVLMVAFAYIWKRGDLDWVRAVSAELPEESEPPVPRRRSPSLAVAQTAL